MLVFVLDGDFVPAVNCMLQPWLSSCDDIRLPFLLTPVAARIGWRPTQKEIRCRDPDRGPLCLTKTVSFPVCMCIRMIMTGAAKQLPAYIVFQHILGLAAKKVRMQHIWPSDRIYRIALGAWCQYIIQWPKGVLST